MGLIYHIATRPDWIAAQTNGTYEAPSFVTEGYIHCSTPEQILTVADRLFRGQRDLVLLQIDEARVDANVVYENCEGGESPFPHVYGPLPCDAVTCARDFPPRADGTFAMPAAM